MQKKWERFTIAHYSMRMHVVTIGRVRYMKPKQTTPITYTLILQQAIPPIAIATMVIPFVPCTPSSTTIYFIQG